MLFLCNPRDDWQFRWRDEMETVHLLRDLFLERTLGAAFPSYTTMLHKLAALGRSEYFPLK